MSTTDDRTALDQATRYIARTLDGRLLPGVDPNQLATAIIRTLIDQRWRPPHRPAPSIPRGRRDPDVYRRGAARARAALQHARTRLAQEEKQ